MDLLTGGLPRTVNIKGVEYPIETDFRTFIQFELIMNDDEDDLVQVAKAMHLVYGEELPADAPGAVDALLWFYSGGQPQKMKKAQRTYYFDHDADYIYSAFLDQYGIDLSDVEYLHWWKFRALFRSLKEDNEIVKIIGFRSVKVDSRMPKDRRKFYTRMKAEFAPPLSARQLKRQEELDKMLMRK